MELTTAFLDAWAGKACDGLEGELAAVWADAVATMGDLRVEPARFGRHLGARAPVEGPAVPSLRGLHTADLYLACGCEAGVPVALRRFEERLLVRVEQYLVRVRADAALVEETRQDLRVRLLLARDGAPPRIAQYSGQGPLESWVRVAAVRAALNVITARGRGRQDGALDEDRIADDCDVELGLLRERYRASFAVALRQAVAELPAQERALLRFRFVDGLVPGHIAGIYGVHRTTILRRIEAVQALVLERTRAEVIRKLQISPSECDSILNVVRSRLHVTLSALLMEAASA
jgi:RNA polymerase sigma-70 factor (ECF subfamily)